MFFSSFSPLYIPGILLLFLFPLCHNSYSHYTNYFYLSPHLSFSIFSPVLSSTLLLSPLRTPTILHWQVSLIFSSPPLSSPTILDTLFLTLSHLLLSLLTLSYLGFQHSHPLTHPVSSPRSVLPPFHTRYYSHPLHTPTFLHPVSSHNTTLSPSAHPISLTISALPPTHTR